jgi:hypothetical protein
MALNGRTFNDITMMWAKPQEALTMFQTMHFTKFFEWWHDY